ncbi:unnamed protein product [Tilletia controversa]|nr:unnamed protein product [Tilletia controversa]
MTVWHRPPWLLGEGTFIVAIMLLSVYLVVHFIVIFEKVRRGATWVLRFGQGEKKSLIIPHAQNSWTVCCTVFYLLVLLCVCDDHISYQNRKPMQHIPLWVVCIPIPFAYGSWLQLWGIFIAAVPRQLTGAFTSFRVPARVLNAVCLSFPPLFLSLLMIPTALADYDWHRIVTKDWPAFQDRYQNETELSREMLVDAQQIWNRMLHMCLMLSVACAVWIVIGIAVTFLHIGIVWSTVRSLRKFMATQQAAQRHLAVSASSTGDDLNRSPARCSFRNRLSKVFDSRETSQSTMDSAESSRTRLGTDLPRHQGAMCQPVAGTAINRGHQHAQTVITYFTVQCGCMFLGSIGMTVIATSIVASLYSAMEQQSRIPILTIALTVLCYVTLIFGAVNVVSVACFGLEIPMSALLRAKVSAAKTEPDQDAIKKATAKDSSPELGGGRDLYPRTRMGRRQNRTNDRPHLDLESQSYHEILHGALESLLIQGADESTRRPSSVRRPRALETAVLCSRGPSSTAVSSTTLALPALPCTYSGLKVGHKSSDEHHVPSPASVVPALLRQHSSPQ